ncbi:MAG: SDR family NAD(P)-dependent oxidoreductase, partial [Enterococcus sp.]
MLSNKTIVVTGGTSGIGYDSVKLFLENGANVVVIGRSEK